MIYVKIFDNEMHPCGVAAFEQGDIQALIPDGTSVLNPLVNMSFVTTAIATSTATFQGTYETLEELQAVTDADDNDYGYVEDEDEYGNMFYKRYKFNGEEWVYEFSLSNTQFNQAQWGAINSGATKDIIDKRHTYYGACSTAAATAAKEVTIADYKAAAGDVITIKFANDVPANATLNISTKGARNIKYKGANIAAGIIKGGDTAMFVDDGTNINLVHIDATLDLLVSLRGKDVVYETT